MKTWANFTDFVAPLEGSVENRYRHTGGKHIGLEEIKYKMKAIDILSRKKLAAGLKIFNLN
jgi:hypothetical protein